MTDKQLKRAKELKKQIKTCDNILSFEKNKAEKVLRERNNGTT